ncbi:MAG: DUF835 domain-containing protein [Candidatus Methanofastidiosia archaeon]
MIIVDYLKKKWRSLSEGKKSQIVGFLTINQGILLVLIGEITFRLKRAVPYKFYLFLEIFGIFEFAIGLWYLIRSGMKLDEEKTKLEIEIKKRMVLENTLRDSEKKYRTLVEHSLDGIALVQNLRIIFANDAFLKIFGYKDLEEIVGESIEKIISPYSKVDLILERLQNSKEMDASPLEFSGVRKDGTVIDVEMLQVGLLYKETPATQVIVRDVTEKRFREERALRRTMKFRVEFGKVYLISERELKKGLDVFLDLLRCGYKGLIITRTHPELLKKKLKINSPIFWISESSEGKENVLSPNLDELERVIKEKVFENRVVLLNRLDYLIQKNDFSKVLSFIQRLNDFLYFTRSLLLISVDSETLSESELSLLRTETYKVELKGKLTLEMPLYEILKFIHQKDNTYEKPTLKEIKEKFKISRVTARKRVRRLLGMGLITEEKKGRYKILGLTRIGRDFFE